jgi:predicted permease
MDRLATDVRYGIRALGRAPGFTATAALILALGIGAATAVFTGFQAVVLDDPPVADPDRIVLLAAERQPTGAVPLDAEEIDALGRQSRTLLDVAGVATFGAEAVPLTEGDRSLELSMSRVTADAFEVLGARPALGRLLRPEDGEEGAPLVTVISHRTWQREFGGDPGVVGRRLTQTTYQDSYVIVGVAPQGLDYPVGADYWVPARSRDAMNVLARVAPGSTAEVARAEFVSIVRTLDARRSDPRSPATATVRPFSQGVLGDAGPILAAVTGAVALLLLIACVNVGNLLLMRTTQRGGDLVVRRALGATPGAVVRLFLVEAALLAAVGGALGLGVAVALLEVLPALAPARLPRAEMIGLGGPPVALAMGVTSLAVLLFGVAPAVAAGRGDLAHGLRSDGRSATGTSGRRRVRRSLVVAQVALAVILLVGAGLLVRSVQHLTGLDLGYDPERVAIVELGFNRERRESPAETFALLDGALERTRGLPGVTAATPIMSRPFMGSTGAFSTRPMPEGQNVSEADPIPLMPLEVGGAELFRTLGITLVRGRGFLETDREGAPSVAVVSQAAAKRLWPGEDAIGQRIRMVTSEERSWTVVGVAGDTRFRHLLEPTPTIYVPVRQLQILPMVWTIAVRMGDDDLAAVLPALRSVVGDYDPRIKVWRAGTLSDHLARGPLARPRMAAFLLSGFGAAALLLAALGLYGVMALAVRERAHELGLRKALGASVIRLYRDALGEALTTTVAGIIAGLAAVFLLSRMLATLLFGVEPSDPVTLLGVALLLLAVAMAAAYLPARRATRVEAMRVLRGN